MPINNSKIELRTCFMEWLYDEKLLKITFKDNVIIHVFDLYEMVAAVKTYDEFAPYPTLSILGKNNKFSRYAKQLDLTKIRTKNNLCEAIVVRSKHQKYLLNLYYKFYVMPYPVKGFINEKDAIDWIRKIRSINQSPKSY